MIFNLINLLINYGNVNLDIKSFRGCCIRFISFTLCGHVVDVVHTPIKDHIVKWGIRSNFKYFLFRKVLFPITFKEVKPPINGFCKCTTFFNQRLRYLQTTSDTPPPSSPKPPGSVSWFHLARFTSVSIDGRDVDGTRANDRISELTHLVRIVSCAICRPHRNLFHGIPFNSV